MAFIDENLYPPIKIFEWELELLSTHDVQRLKHLAHYGGGAFVSSVTHSRLEHTIGVWKLSAHFFPNNVLLRAAAILHDIGHLPFSHAVERTLGFDHHLLTEIYVAKDEIRMILNKAGLSSEQVINFLNEETVLTGKSGILGIDHLDSFIRDNKMLGIDRTNLFPLLTCTGEGISTNEEGFHSILELIYHDHQWMLSPRLLAVDRLLAEAVQLEWKEPHFQFPQMLDAEVTAALLNSKNQTVKSMMKMILFQSHKLVIEEFPIQNHIKVRPAKLYAKFPLLDGRRAGEDEVVKKHMQKMQDLMKTYYIDRSLLEV
ncbi:HD domain-containing protein [Alkalihalobacillus pseudalcaliphilus]|uniref:HD domain-containing protein n=1 Tax=Alkalihalobacillus pseudalcaliphilus TaxID=79884 RepID=UPI00064DECCA|nr:HD domain-containing protein [Alkalihalobacillus pseudalcaliphilus]KMK75875.1 hypothetical protein AB990_11475 [Alkalihalobacillus pseudalcaliphilus]